MKKFSQLFEAKTIEIQEDSVNYLSTNEIKQYLEIADKFISQEAKDVCQWLIDHNRTYIKDLSTGDTDNALIDFYNKGLPKGDQKSLYANITKVNNNGRILEIPVFMTRTQFDSIINKEASPDEVIMDLNSEEGRNAVAKKYEPLVHKIVNSWVGKTALSRDELMSGALEGLTRAMNTYGRKSDKAIKREEKRRAQAQEEAEKKGETFDPDQDFSGIDISKYKSYTFLQFAAQMIRCYILEAIKNENHLVRIPISRQKKEKEEKGFIAKSNTISGDKHLGGKDGDEGKTLWDIVGGLENPGKEIDKREIESLWDQILEELKKKFGEKTMDIFCNHFGFGAENGKKKLTGKEMAKKYGFSSPSSITAEITKVINFIRKDKKMYQKFCDISDLMREAKHDEDEYAQDDEPIYLSSKMIEEERYSAAQIDDDNDL